VPGLLDQRLDVVLTFDLSVEYVDLLDGRYDIAVRIGARSGPGLVAHRLATGSRVLCAAPAHLTRTELPQTLRDLANHRLVAAEGQLPWHLDGPEGAVAYRGTSHVRTNSSKVVRELTIGGCGIALRSLWDVADALAQGTLQRILPQYQGSKDVVVFSVHAPTPEPSTLLNAFIAHLKASLGKFG
jgi:DNA-binding transcriptional LysR family regulator